MSQGAVDEPRTGPIESTCAAGPKFCTPSAHDTTESLASASYFIQSIIGATQKRHGETPPGSAAPGQEGSRACCASSIRLTLQDPRAGIA